MKGTESVKPQKAFWVYYQLDHSDSSQVKEAGGHLHRRLGLSKRQYFHSDNWNAIQMRVQRLPARKRSFFGEKCFWSCLAQ